MELTFPMLYCRNVGVHTQARIWGGGCDEGNKAQAWFPNEQCVVAQSLSPVGTLCDHMDCSTPGSPVLHHLLEFAQTHVH